MSNIAQYCAEESGVRLELEIGLDSITAFRNLIPYAIFEKMGYGAAPLEKPLKQFFEADRPY